MSQLFQSGHCALHVCVKVSHGAYIGTIIMCQLKIHIGIFFLREWVAFTAVCSLTVSRGVDPRPQHIQTWMIILGWGSH